MKLDFGFSIHSHDSDGDVTEEGVYLHFGSTRIRFENPDQIQQIGERILAMMDEVRESWEVNQ